MKPVSLIFALFISFALQAQTEIWNNLLQKHVDKNGLVDYDGFAKDKSQLNSYLAYVNNTTPKTSWSVNKTKSFWINAYNAYTIRLILDNYPLQSITNIKQQDKNAWEISFAKVGGKKYTLNHIEHQILREQYKDPLIHVGVNCASISCPVLPNKAFTEKNINELLTQGMTDFINDKNRNNLSSDIVELSQIFNWFQDDFTQKTDLITFINQYSHIKINKDAKIVYKEYNWALNNQK
ncbi:hypothetical protein FHR24_000938 [Wenyingzhuangia heitensis]|uniref:DUF547 domain-containing protein n=1 Tax=Wenyingzhuangia heitensis TaxID=1487859 RepID=A0ABX0U832_9FLAO|nr:DUF547 domain-containing protein [Wenyingzhuangia heitensis]NIJ44499.1 hypothetical protein [Wenyingzhuangia heitensis]